MNNTDNFSETSLRINESTSQNSHALLKLVQVSSKVQNDFTTLKHPSHTYPQLESWVDSAKLKGTDLAEENCTHANAQISCHHFRPPN